MLAVAGEVIEGQRRTIEDLREQLAASLGRDSTEQ